LQQLKSNQTRRAWLTYFPRGGATVPNHEVVPDYMLAAFVGGGGTWAILTDRQEDREMWASRWEVSRKDDPAHRIWRVTYASVARWRETRPVSSMPLGEALREMKEALSAIRTFSIKQQHDFWTTWFDRGLSALQSEGAPQFPDYVAPICLNHFPPDAQKLLASAYASWVFGGMGSWNDNVYEDPGTQSENEQVSSRLYAAICAAIQTAVNAFNN
jgi:hypothetical protein